jgi:protein-tyrosine kinase
MDHPLIQPTDRAEDATPAETRVATLLARTQRERIARELRQGMETTPGDALHGTLKPVQRERLLQRRIIALADGHPAATAYKVLRTQVLQRMRANGWTRLAITSPTPRNGKTLTAINLAVTLARDVKQRVLLADFDLRRPSVAQYFYAEPPPGIGEYITEDRSVNEVLIDPGLDRLLLLLANQRFTHSSEALCSPKVTALWDELKRRDPERLFLCDMAPVLGGDDVIAFLPHVDAVLLVVEDGKTTADELAAALAIIDPGKLLGTVVNKSDEGSRTSGYY